MLFREVSLFFSDDYAYQRPYFLIYDFSHDIRAKGAATRARERVKLTRLCEHLKKKLYQAGLEATLPLSQPC